MKRRKFKISHSLLGTFALVILEALFVGVIGGKVGLFAVLVAALAGGAGIVVIATDVIEEVRESRRMLIFLSVTVSEFLIFFAFQYHFLGYLDPMDFQGLAGDPITLLLHSTMIFALNPLYLPVTLAGKTLLLINTAESLVLALFVLQ